MGLRRRLRLGAKHAIDRVGAGVMLCAIGPLFTGIAVAIKLDDGGEIFFRQERVGQDGRSFHIWKFRTMVPDAMERGQGYFTADFITPMGKLLRKTSLDELPQLLNILTGDMSFVGPRPTLRDQTDRYTPAQARRLEVRPGVAGWAQLHGRNTLPWSERIKFDVEYVDRAGPLFDLYIVLRTIPMVLTGSGVTMGQQTREDVDDLGSDAPE
jgi:lipopolysaccharide/colanic/teichoic acid biosynthesis glycosyltransferase